MGWYETAYWESDAEAPTRQDRMSGSYRPYHPDMIADASLSLSFEAVRACEQAALNLAEFDGAARYSSTAESLARILLRSEALSSSRIEGLEVNARRVLELEALEELGVQHRMDSTEAEVMGSIASMRTAIDEVSHKETIELDDILLMHRTLLQGTRLAEYGGMLRQTQNWIGGSWYHPLSAAYVPPAAELVKPLMEDVVAFINRSDVPAVALAAIAHAQFETIHPFVDGNGRTGRALVHVLLRRAGLCTRTIVPVSLVLSTRKQQYLSALEGYRFDNADAGSPCLDEAMSAWIEFFAHALNQACAQAMRFEGRIEDLRSRWQESVRPRKNSAAELLLDALPGNPVVSIASVARLTDRSYPAARGAVRQLEEREVLVQNSKNRKSGLYVAPEVLDEFTYYERALATESGDTRIEKPRRPVPQRPACRPTGYL